MTIEVLMPALSPTMTEGKRASWKKKEGDAVKSGDVLAEIETDKATMEVEAVDEGTLGKILVPDGTEAVKVNEPIALILEEGEDASSLAGAGAAPAPKAAAAPPAAAPPATKAAAPVKANGGGVAPPSPGTRVGFDPQPDPPAQVGDPHRVFASPLARRMAEQARLDLKALKGSGPNGRIVKSDIDAALKGGAPRATAAAAAPAPVAVSSSALAAIG